jgi:hypothetical protein
MLLKYSHLNTNEKRCSKSQFVDLLRIMKLTIMAILSTRILLF